MADTPLPGVFADMRPTFVGIYATFERYKWYVIAVLVIVIAIVITHRVRRRRAAHTA